MILYSLRTAEFGHTITKFDSDLNPEATYDVTMLTCTCPAGPRDSCRHRKMLAKMISYVDTDWFYCYETNAWHRPFSEPATEKEIYGEGSDEVIDVTEQPKAILTLPEPIVQRALEQPLVRRRT